MVKGKKEFRGLNSLIQSTVNIEEPEELTVIEETTTRAVEETVTKAEAEAVPEPKPKQERKRAEKEKQVTITIPANLKKSIKKYCATNDITIKELFINSVTRYMKG